MENLHEYVYSDEVLDFVKKGNELTEILTPSEDFDQKEFAIALLRILPGMYSSIQNIPATEPLFDGGNEKFVSEEEWSAIFQFVAGIMGSQNEYLDIPSEEEYDRTEIISRSLSEDLADIYQDIRDFLELYRNGTEEIMNDAMWECRMNFESYWGEKILRASLSLHRIISRDDETRRRMDQEWEEKHGGREINTDNWILSKRQKDFGGDSDF
jgi:hypothetical protein